MEHGKNCGCVDCVDWRIALETRRTGICARCKGAGIFQVGLVSQASVQTVTCPCQGKRLSDLDELVIISITPSLEGAPND